MLLETKTVTMNTSDLWALIRRFQVVETDILELVPNIPEEDTEFTISSEQIDELKARSNYYWDEEGEEEQEKSQKLAAFVNELLP